jgi:hypothetical protein
VKIQITESQLNRLHKVINEANTAIDNLNNLINPKEVFVTTGFVAVSFQSIIIEGSIKDDDLSVRAMIDKIKYDGKDVTEFALAWALRDEWTSEDLPLGTQICIDISNFVNKEALSLVGSKVSEYDVILE